MQTNEAKTPRILNVGAGNRIIAGAVNHDIVCHRPEITAVHDLNVLPWPWADESFDLIVARAVLEHLHIDLIESVDECWRILAPGGQLHLKLPHWQHDHTYLDPTHRHRFSLRTVEIFDPATEYGGQYAWYTPRKWRITKGPWMNRCLSSIYVRMAVRK